MRRILNLVTAVFITLVLAKETSAAFYLPEEPGDLPSCQNQVLRDKVLNRIKAYQKENPPSNIVEKRRQLLLLKNLNSFVQVDSRNFTSKDEVRTANKLITVKINNGLEDSDIVLCKSSGSGEEYNIYLIVYPDGEGQNIVSIENFIPLQIGGSDLSFKF